GRLPPALGLLREEDRGFLQDLALLTQDPVLPPQTVELSPLVTIKPGPGAASDVRAFHPLPERVAAHAQLVSYLLQRPPALAEQPYRLDLELKRVGRISGSSLHGQSFPSNLAQAGICPPKRGNSTWARPGCVPAGCLAAPAHPAGWASRRACAWPSPWRRRGGEPVARAWPRRSPRRRRARRAR